MIKLILFGALVANIIFIASTDGDDDQPPCNETPPPSCGDNEEYCECTNGGYIGARNCSDIGKPRTYYDIKQDDCEKGCICKDGYLRDCAGVCIPQDQCPNLKCNGPHEQYDCCAILCPPQTCEYALGAIHVCPLIFPPPCAARCSCKPGFYRNEHNHCVSKEECSKMAQSSS